jgi:predicted DNA-binding transcriptional regulator AlpA
MRQPESRMMKAQFLRRKAVCAELGVTRHTLAVIIATDKRFPVFFEISPGITVIERRDLEGWIRLKKTLAHESAPQ